MASCGMAVACQCVLWPGGCRVGLPATRRKPTANTDATNCSSKGLGAGAFALALVWWWAYPMAQGACTSLACQHGGACMHTQTKCTAALHCQLHMCGGHHWQLAQGDWCIVVRPNPLRAYLAAPLRGPCMGLHSSQLIGMHACVHACACFHGCMHCIQ